MFRVDEQLWSRPLLVLIAGVVLIRFWFFPFPGVSASKWAIEYDSPAAEAFKLNHPTADVFCENCNVILR